ncbi:MAG: CopG family transcriptional regulator [Myxococcota bacterium]
MRRTQIYLEDIESIALDETARRTGRTRSQIIREAIRAHVMGATDPRDLTAVLRKTAGAWRGRRQTGAQVVARLRRGRLSALHRKRS